MVPETIEKILFTLRYKIDQYIQRKKSKRVESAGGRRPPAYQQAQQYNQFPVQMPMTDMSQNYQNMPPMSMNVAPSMAPVNASRSSGKFSNVPQLSMDKPAMGGFDGYPDAALQEKDNQIGQLRETVEILELKIKKLEQLVKLKDAKIGNLTNKLTSMGIN